MKATTKINMLTEPLITLAIPALILMKLSGTEHLGVVQELMFALAFPLVWGMRDIIHRKKIACSPYQRCSSFCLPEVVCSALNSNHRLKRKLLY
jgi:hypothetical protein